MKARCPQSRGTEHWCQKTRTGRDLTWRRGWWRSGRSPPSPRWPPHLLLCPTLLLLWRLLLLPLSPLIPHTDLTCFSVSVIYIYIVFIIKLNISNLQAILNLNQKLQQKTKKFRFCLKKFLCPNLNTMMKILTVLLMKLRMMMKQLIQMTII